MSDRETPGLNRRHFIGALGGAAAAGAILEALAERDAKAENRTGYWYRDSFGRIVPAGSRAVELGVHPPGIVEPPAGSNGTYYNATPTNNVLLIMVDQMRSPGFWPPPTGSATVLGQLPNIQALANKSFYFPYYFTAATVCGPARASLLTGLYAQQTCIFRSQPTGAPPPGKAPASGVVSSPPMLPYNNSWVAGDPPGFPTIGNVLSQTLPIAGSHGLTASYNCTWLGKWHVSCAGGTLDGTPGEYGPTQYGFNNKYSLPNAASTVYPRSQYASPNGLENEGNGGDFLDSLVPPTTKNDVPAFAESVPGLHPEPSLIQLNDAAIALAFTKYWLPNAPLTPWFCAVSFVNPHDISDFPYPYALTSYPQPGCSALGLCAPAGPTKFGYQPPPTAGAPAINGTECAGGPTQCATPDGDVTSINPVPSLYTGLPASWNWEDPVSMPYTATGGKPGLQAFFESTRNSLCGTIAAPSGKNSNPAGWTTFLNYYVWMQNCVDVQVGNVLDALENSSYGSNTVIVFTSDHGEFGGSHGIHAKGGAVYDEVMNVPLYVSFPKQRTSAQTVPEAVPFLCSSVDLLPFFYSLVLGNESWRNNPNDMVSYLGNRESIGDAIFQYTSPPPVLQQRRVCGAPLLPLNPAAGITGGQPYVLHTHDDYSAASIPGSKVPQPSHVIAFRSCDLTDPIMPSNGQNAYGGGKLGMYSYWQTCGLKAPPITGLTNVQTQYEFYNFSHKPAGGDSPAPNINPGEVGNQYFPASGSAPNEAQVYLSQFSSGAIQNELYSLYTDTNPQVTAAIQVAFNNYIDYLACSSQLTDSNGNITDACPSETCSSYQA